MSGRRVLVTRAAHQAGRLSELLSAHGLTPVEVPVLEIQPPESFAPLDSALEELESFDWLIVTSTNAVEALAARAVMRKTPLSAFEKLEIAAIGSATAKAVQKAGFEPALVPEKYVAESLVEALHDRVRGRKVLLARAAVARDLIPEALQAAGAQVVVADAYRNVMPASAPQQLQRALQERVDAATFTSSSSVKHLANAADAARIAFPLPGIRAVSIGPITSATLREAGWEPAAEAEPSDLSGLVVAVARVLGVV